MSTMDWDKLRLFYAVAEAGSFTTAAARLGGSQSALSRQIQALEEMVGAALFHRHARGLALTHEGEQLLAATRDVTDRLDRAVRAIQETRSKPSGELRLTTTVSFGSTWLPRQLSEFFTLYPDIKLDVILTDEELDLTRRQADVAIRFYSPRQTELIARPLAHVRFALCASPGYLEKHGTPATIAELDQHHIVAFGNSAPDYLRSANWILEVGDPDRPRKPVLTLNNLFGLTQAVKTGIGIAALPDYLIRWSSGLVPILPDFEGPSLQTYFVYPSELRRSTRVSVLRDFLLSRINDDAFTA
jgi:DNA-binding transcriptional LysR family regulator